MIRKLRRKLGSSLADFCTYYLARRGYGFYKLKSTIDHAAAMTVKESEYYTEWRTPCPLFSPWVGHPDFRRVYEGVKSLTVVSPERCYMLASLARSAMKLNGNFAECGVYKGGTALLLARVLEETTDKKFYLFDSFEGLSKENKEHDNCYREGNYAFRSVESVKQALRDYERFIDIRKGWIPETFTGLENERDAFVHVDVDLYQAALDCCEYFYPRLVAGSVMVFDDYGFPACRGEKDAVDEFFEDKPESPTALLTGQAMVFKLPCSMKDAS